MSRRTLPFVGLNSCERIRPERPRNPIQRLVWSGAQFQVGHLDPVEDEASNPRMALRRLLRLYEGRQYREAAGFLMRLPGYTLRAALPDIPIDLLIETLPHSLALLEALYSRLSELNVDDAKILRVEQVLWKVVHLVSSTQDHFHVRIWAKLLAALQRLAPTSKNALATRRRALERAVEGLGKHGLVPSARSKHSENANTQNLVPLPIALKEELELRTEAYKLALHKIESFGKHAGSHKDHWVQAASHQRQLSLKYSEIQQRLIDNQSLLNTLEKTSSLSFENLLDELKRRVEQDKEALRQWAPLRKSDGSSTSSNKNPALAARLLQFSRGCGLALQLMSENNPQELHLENNVLDDYEEESSSAGYHTDESGSPTPEPEVRNESVDGQENFQNIHIGQPSVEQLTERYGALYAQAHLHTLDALDALDSLKDTPDLKAKILYSVVVLSWRLAGMIQSSRRLEALKILNGINGQPMGTSNVSVSTEMDNCIRHQLATAGVQTGAQEVAKQVVNQLERTLYDFPCLRGCTEIKQYAANCSSLAWICLARTTPLVLDVAQGVEFRREVHARHHASTDPNGARIRSVLWPGLREGCQGPCLYKAVVLTS
ncbi:uncharacterized protein LOC107267552 [Cephus cinctus]|uniref:Mitochondria-eating protein n=1 Tax=Cephus cinctus TaxID=211228 RepID=A0AAJ7W1J7_CEPCN|nr:uncharacterized protein LOC107267552 [Cephus cinctus]XP_024940612.1 uncharacterized protein LOC107267552 [Cephus cinctus]XP_024940613.1 uncharacterized protein LOC107267552 [Cephus cinctus]XP_024940614.1 uncharacterized protein LOC107267552 [Cephus cinctus]XP_024940615.1 uncharacterized protein LOC107267552 [Cephus cinctus]